MEGGQDSGPWRGVSVRGMEGWTRQWSMEGSECEGDGGMEGGQDSGPWRGVSVRGMEGWRVDKTVVHGGE